MLLLIIMQRKDDWISPDLHKLVQSGAITKEDAHQMMPPKLTPDLAAMVAEGGITLEQAEGMMSTVKPDPKVVRVCGNLVSKGSISPKAAGQILSTIQSQEQHKQMRDKKDKLKEDNPLLTQCWSSRAAAIDAIKYHSTAQGKRVMVGSSGSHKAVLECASKLSGARSKKATTLAKNKNNQCGCKYRAVLKRSKLQVPKP